MLVYLFGCAYCASNQQYQNQTSTAHLQSTIIHGNDVCTCTIYRTKIFWSNTSLIVRPVNSHLTSFIWTIISSRCHTSLRK